MEQIFNHQNYMKFFFVKTTEQFVFMFILVTSWLGHVTVPFKNSRQEKRRV